MVCKVIFVSNPTTVLRLCCVLVGVVAILSFKEGEGGVGGEGVCGNVRRGAESAHTMLEQPLMIMLVYQVL